MVHPGCAGSLLSAVLHLASQGGCGSCKIMQLLRTLIVIHKSWRRYYNAATWWLHITVITDLRQCCHNSLSIHVTTGTSCFKVQDSNIFPTHNMFHVIPKTNSYFPNSTNQMAFVMVKQCVFCTEGAELNGNLLEGGQSSFRTTGPCGACKQCTDFLKIIYMTDTLQIVWIYPSRLDLSVMWVALRCIRTYPKHQQILRWGQWPMSDP